MQRAQVPFRARLRGAGAGFLAATVLVSVVAFVSSVAFLLAGLPRFACVDAGFSCLVSVDEDSALALLDALVVEVLFACSALESGAAFDAFGCLWIVVVGGLRFGCAFAGSSEASLAESSVLFSEIFSVDDSFVPTSPFPFA